MSKLTKYFRDEDGALFCSKCGAEERQCDHIPTLTKAQEKICEHKEFNANVNVIRLEDSGRFQAEVTIECKCGTKFQFLGLPLGLNLSGASMGVDSLEARLSIAPVGEVPHPLKGVLSFTVTKSN